MARSETRRARIRAEDRIEAAMADLETQAGPEAVAAVARWFHAEWPHPDHKPETPEEGHRA